jgi:large subunit ribosomal protein L3
MAFYPRKKASRIYPTVTSFKNSDKSILLGFVGYKAGMTHIIATDTYENSPSYGQKIAIPVTILETPPLFVFGVRLYEKTAYGLKVLGDVYTDKPIKALNRLLNLPKKYDQAKAMAEAEKEKDNVAEIRVIVCTQPSKISLKKTPELLEITIGGKVEDAMKHAFDLLGKEANINSTFAEGAFVDVTGITKGKGTQGPVKRFGIKIQVRKAHGHLRMPGAIGAWTPSRVFHTVPMRGQMGFQRRTELNKHLLKIGKEGKEVSPEGGIVRYGNVTSDYVLIKGSVPGPKKRLLFVRHALREDNRPVPSIVMISRHPQQ